MTSYYPEQLPVICTQLILKNVKYSIYKTKRNNKKAALLNLAFPI